jgi:hypothetical protein
MFFASNKITYGHRFLEIKAAWIIIQKYNSEEVYCPRVNSPQNNSKEINCGKYFGNFQNTGI